MKTLLVIDVQEKYLSYYSADLVSKINARIAAAKSDRAPVFYVRNIGIHGDNDSYNLAKDLLIASDKIYENNDLQYCYNKKVSF